jgi:hypothetical protein
MTKPTLGDDADTCGSGGYVVAAVAIEKARVAS